MGLAARAALLGIDINPILASGDPIYLDAIEFVIDEAEERQEIRDNNFAVLVGVQVSRALGGDPKIRYEGEGVIDE